MAHPGPVDAGSGGAAGGGALMCVAPTPYACDGECRACCVDADCRMERVCTSSGICAPVCESPRSLCVDRCVNLQSDATNCGTCGTDCGRGRSCATGVCTPSWVATSAPPGTFVARERSAYVAMDGKVFIWGGVDTAGGALQTGAIYDPSSDNWTDLPIDAATPSGRASAMAVWTGTEVVLWGGGDGSNENDYADGARYNPKTRVWQRIATEDAPSERRAAYGFWTGSRVLLWSGVNKELQAVESEANYSYDPVADDWSKGEGEGSPPPGDLIAATVAWSGSVLYVFGGHSDGQDRGDLFEWAPALSRWSKRVSGPGARHSAFGAWDGSSFFVWGGVASVLSLADGQRWTPDPQNAAGGSWANLGQEVTPRSAHYREGGWTAALAPGKLLMVGGARGLAGFTSDSVAYDLGSNAWTDLQAWPSGHLHLFGVAAWTGAEFVLWGGRSSSGGGPSSQGERFRP